MEKKRKSRNNVKGGTREYFKIKRGITYSSSKKPTFRVEGKRYEKGTLVRVGKGLVHHPV